MGRIGTREIKGAGSDGIYLVPMSLPTAAKGRTPPLPTVNRLSQMGLKAAVRS